MNADVLILKYRELSRLHLCGALDGITYIYV